MASSRHLQVESDTGFVACRDADARTSVRRVGELKTSVTASVTLWACGGISEATPAGNNTALDCHENHLKRLEFRGFLGLEWLDCHGNAITTLNVSGLTALHHLDCSSNRLGALSLAGRTKLI